jgi:glycosyltransferase involved in cell wall biosynthesis
MESKVQLKILYLYSELVGYQMPIFKTYVEKYKARVHVVNWDKNKIKPYSPPPIEGVTFYKRSEFSKEDLLIFTQKIQPDIIYISGWMDKGYLYVTKRMKKENIPIVTAFDDIWKGSIRQRIGALIFPFYFKKFFTHAWVAGPFQFEFAKRLGFKNSEVIFDMLSADSSIFQIDKGNIMNTNIAQSKSFLYVGNFRQVKGVDILLEAYNIYRNIYNGKWKMICVGNGELENSIKQNIDIEVLPFSSYETLKEISKRTSVFILPSRHDQWGVVTHEFVLMGMPLLLSENVGAKATFLIEYFNGLIFRDNSATDLAKKMLAFSNFTDSELNEMSKNSYILSKRINVSTSAANFMSIINK